MEAKGTYIKLGSMQIYQSSFDLERSHFLESVITFFHKLAQASILCSQAILEGGGLDFLLHLYLANFSNPLAGAEAQMFDRCLQLRVACDSLLYTLSNTEQGSKLISEHQLRVLWPTTPSLQFTNTISGRPVERTEIWGSIQPIFIILRLNVLLEIIRAETVYSLNPLGDIVHDILVFLR